MELMVGALVAERDGRGTGLVSPSSPMLGVTRVVSRSSLRSSLAASFFWSLRTKAMTVPSSPA